MGMMILEKIETDVDKNIDLTSYMVEGKVTAEQIISTIETFHKKKPTKYVLWDFSAMNVDHLQFSEIESIAYFVIKYAYTGNAAKTALVFSSEDGFGLGRTFEAYCKIEGIPQKIMSFYAVDEARKWLNRDYWG